MTNPTKTKHVVRTKTHMQAFSDERDRRIVDWVLTAESEDWEASQSQPID
jgi:hypothetical protein